MSYHAALRLTPSNSPFLTKNVTPRSPTRPTKTEEPGLHLTKVIGTTAASAAAFAGLPSTRQFAFTAGAAGVLATVADDLHVTQQFFRASPGAPLSCRDGSASFPLTPTPNEARNRAVGSLKDQAFGASPLGASTRDWADSPNGRSSTAKDRIKTATSVALSPNGKWLAVGETGYKPRILLFATKDGSSETPVAVLAEHSFGVHALGFSPDGKFLASLGTVNDGFLHVWSLDDRTGGLTLHSSNKCTALVHAMCWMGQTVVMAGLRYVKVWRPSEDGAATDLRSSEAARNNLTPRQRTDYRSSDFGNSILSPKHRVLVGKNALLGDLIDAIFVAVLPISESKALLCAESGQVCVLDDTEKTQTLSLAAKTAMRISAARLSMCGDVLHVMGRGDRTASFDISELLQHAGRSSHASQRQASPPSTPDGTASKAVIGACAMPGVIVEVLSNRMIELSQCDEDSKVLHTRQLAAHEDPVLGVQHLQSAIVPEVCFLTYSSNGSMRFWDHDGCSVGDALKIPVPSSPDMYGIVNELKAVVPLPDGIRIVAGDRYGTITLLDMQTRQVLQQVRAHAAEISGLIAFERAGVHCMVSASRDRTVQLFVCTATRIELLQTLDEHASAVTGLLVTKDRNYLLSCSADRSIVVREAMLRDAEPTKSIAFAMLRTITLKSAPTSFCLGPEDDSVLVATVDRCIGKYSIKGGQASFSFKCSDSDNGEAVVMSKISYVPSLHGNPTIAGVSSSDKSVRLYSEYGTLLARDWGHTEGITDMALVYPCDPDQTPVSRSPRIVTVAADSTIFLWESIASSLRSASQSSDIVKSPDTISVPLGPPLRKVLSYSEISRFRREPSLDEVHEMSPPSPTTMNGGRTISTSPQRLRKKSSRLSVAPTPRLEPSFRNNFDASRRRSLRHRSPSPPSPRHPKRDVPRRPSLGTSLRSKSSEHLLNTISASGPTGGGFGSLTASTESVCRTLRSYRKKLATSSDSIGPEALRELERELKLTARLVGEKSQSKSLDEATMAHLLDRASDKIVGLLDEKIKARLETETMRKTSDDFALAPSPRLESPAELDEETESSDLTAAAVTVKARPAI